MPDGQTHRKLTLAAAGCMAPLVCLAPGPILVMEAGVLLTLWRRLNPDSDLNRPAREYNELEEMAGLRVIAEVIPHRGGLARSHWRGLKRAWVRVFFFSHVPLAGTLLRAGLVILPLWLVALALGQPAWFWRVGPLAGWPVWLWLGMAWSDAWHVAADLWWPRGEHPLRGRRTKWTTSRARTRSGLSIWRRY